MSTLLAAPRIQLMQTIDEDDLGHSPLVSILPVDRQEQHHGYISNFPYKDCGLGKDPPPHRKPVEAAQDWCDMVPASSTRD